jgi:TonB-linked SusC/RagA family outer membrane protein
MKREKKIADFRNLIQVKVKKLMNLTALSLLLITSLQVLASPNWQQNAKVTGKVTGQNNEPLLGVSVTAKGTSVGTSTDAGGNYTLSVPAGSTTLVFSSVGYTSQEVAIGGRATVNVTLAPSRASLDEIVVIGYGTANKRDLTGSIVKISGKEVADKPNSNPVSSLQSKVAGLSVITSAVPGTEPDIRIRGTISIGSVKPLYVVDGILNDNINFLNPNDIESIEVLKDPSSLAIYGVRGGAGVIAITTKKARAGQVTVNVNSSYGIKKLVDKIEMANASEFKTLVAQEAENRFNENGSTILKDFVNNELSKWTGNTDWIDALTRTAHFTNNNISLSASTDKNRLYMGVGYTLDEGLVRHTKYDRIGINLNDEFKISNAFKVGFTSNVSREKYPYSGATGQLAEAKRIAPVVDAGTKPFLTNLYGGDSVLTNLYSVLPVVENTLANPVLQLENNWNTERDQQYRFVGSAYGEVNFLKDFNFRATLYGDMGHRDQRVYTPLYDAYNPLETGSAAVVHFSTVSRVRQTNFDYNKYQQDYVLTYKKNFGPHGFTGTAGWSTYYSGDFERSGNVSQKTGGDPIPNNDRFWYVSNGFGDESSQRSSSYQKENATTSALFRVLYNYKNKYYLNGSFRRDGSSLIYNPDTRYQNFWAIGAAWELTREHFMDNQKFFNFLKLKASMGVLGNQNTYGTDYPYFPTISSTASAVFGSNVYPAYANNYLVDPNLKWETVHGKEVGVEFNALKNRLHTEITYYYKETKDMLSFLRPIGLPPSLTNLGGLLNKGWEFAASWSQNINKDLSFTASANLTTFSNKVTRLDYPLPADEQYPNQTEVGYPIGHFFGYVVEGLYQSYSDKLNSPKVEIGVDYGPGDFKYKDISGPDGKPDGIINEKDKTDIGNPTPDFSYGASVSVNYKNFDLGIDLGGVYGNEIYRYWNTSENIFSLYNYPKYDVEAWNGPGTSNWVPIVNQTRKINRLPSTFGIEDGSYLRIRNLQIGYNFRQAALTKAHIKNIRIFVNAQNLKTWKHNLGYSPEFIGGLANGQTAVSFGIDTGDANGAIPAVYTAGINITF